ncbi:hypothetical protein ALI22I_08480 [Saccharothrix sp. ALI-22-I]|uniref:hypothetical protein n=1 Tax=Saccharothrix sp. ALI-22-I TaxID=1933778 RepID=UPI00097C56C3|nr:hypothetical protein [Saccharothrix sp. ALI-22-I]ONI91394.1 hypothetical protein ALI22I_08480 [Saccharothrix sp. ALI-22-I]
MFAIVLVPVVLGMLVRRWSAAFADRADRSARIFSAVVLVAVIAGAIIAELDNIGGYLTDIGLVAVLFCACSLTAGYLLPRLAKVGRRQAAGGGVGVRGGRAQQHVGDHGRADRAGQ